MCQNRSDATTESDDSITALSKLHELASAFCTSQIFFTACKLDIFNHLGPGCSTIGELAQKLTLNTDATGRILAALVALGLVESVDGEYRNSNVGAFLTSTSEVPLRALSMWAHPFYQMWELLPTALQEYGPQWEQALGLPREDAFAALYADPNRLRSFCELMAAYSTPLGRAVAEQFDFSSHRVILDVAGGPGAFAIEIGRKYPNLRGIIMDLPAVCSIAEEYISRAGLAERFRAEPADLFQGEYPKGADVLVVSRVLHNWNDDHCHVILEHCYRCLPAGGVLLISESILRDHYLGSLSGVLSSLQLLLTCEPGARERGEGEHRRLLADVGFSEVEVVRLQAPRDLIIARKA